MKEMETDMIARATISGLSGWYFYFYRIPRDEALSHA